MKKIFVLILIIFTVPLFTACSKLERSSNVYKDILKNDYITIGVKNDTKPFGFINKNGQLEGFDIDLAKMLTKELLGDEKKVKFVAVTPQDRILKLNTGKVDMVIATMSITP